MKILQIIPAVPGARFGGRDVEYFATLENTRGEQYVLSVGGAMQISPRQLVDWHLYLVGISPSEGAHALRAWADESTVPTLLEEVFDQAQHALSPDLYERVRKTLGR